MPIAQLIAGIAVASAIIRWSATLRILGWRAVSRASPMARLRWTQYGSRWWWVWIRPAAFIGLLLLVQFAFRLALGGWAAVFTIIRWLAVAVLGTVATYICPPVVLFLGSSEPGSYELFRYLSDRYSWITVGALKESDLRATGFSDFRRSITSRLMPHRLRSWLNWFAPPSLESLRASDQVWGDIVGRALRICDTVLLDLRSGGLFVRKEFVDVLHRGAIDRTVAIIRNDGTSCIDNLISDRPEILSAFRFRIRSEELRQGLHGGWTPLKFQAGLSRDTLASAELGAALEERLRRRSAMLNSLSSRIIVANVPDPELDRDIVMALEPSSIIGCSYPPVTSSSDEAGAFIRRVAPDAQYSLHLTDELGRFGAGVGREGILGSFRTIMSRRIDHQTAGLALMDAFVRSELGYGVGTGKLTHVLMRTTFPTEPVVSLAVTVRLSGLLERVRLEIPDQTLDADLMNSLGEETGANYDLQPTANLDDALHLIHVSSAEWRAGVYVDATVGTAFAEVYKKHGAGYKVALSMDEDGTGRDLSPARAVLSGWLKGRLEHWSFYGQAGGSIKWCLGTMGERTALSDGDRRTLGTNARQIERRH